MRDAGTKSMQSPHVVVSDQKQFRYSSEDLAAGTYTTMVQGIDAFGPHERIMIHRQQMVTVRTVASYVAAVAFAAIGAALIVSAPKGRDEAVNAAAATLLVLAAGLAGFTSLSAKMPGYEIRADKFKKPD